MTIASHPSGAPCPAPITANDDPAAHARAVAFWNDTFRIALGADPVARGRVVATRGVAALGRPFVDAALAAVAAFTAFDADNDPDGVHDFGVVRIHGVAVWFKIDCYDRAYQYGADNPADPGATRRVLTLLLPDEY